MDYIITIPTFNRVELLKNKTLKMLQDNNIPSHLIFLVVHSLEQRNLYKENIPTELYNSILITNVNDGWYGQVNWILQHYPEGTRIVKLDDDISHVSELIDNKLVKTTNLDKIIQRGYELCYTHGAKLFGLYPSANPFYMIKQKEYTVDLRFIVGPFFGIICEKIDLDLQVKVKGDYDYSIKSYMNNGSVIRLNRISFKYDLAKNEGTRSIQMMNDSVYLQQLYPQFVRMNLRRTQGEILLKTKAN
tara:strand:+ start:924 stop:1661 length:738 start_codon:yes stop_codon:yes gene_type:complete